MIESASGLDKEFHFQDWFEQRLNNLAVHYERSGRNTFPDFSLVEKTEAYEVKGLKFPGREGSYDSNSQAPTGNHNGRQIYYVFGRYPADLAGYDDLGNGRKQYPVVDLVLCHGDFLNADHNYLHKNEHVKGFGTYGDIMIRDRKMYVAPTPFALTDGTTGLLTLIVPGGVPLDQRFQQVGELVRTEADSIVVGYSFDLRTNRLAVDTVLNPQAGAQHRFIACRLTTQSDRQVSMLAHGPVAAETEAEDETE